MRKDNTKTQLCIHTIRHKGGMQILQTQVPYIYELAIQNKDDLGISARSTALAAALASQMTTTPRHMIVIYKTDKGKRHQKHTYSL